MVFKRTIGRFAMLIASISGMVGSGWLLVPFHAVKIAGPAAIISWILAGILMIFIAYTFIILTRALPITGGTVRFLQLSHGNFVGFTFSWIAWLAWIAVTPIEVLAVIQYAATWMPNLMDTVQGGHVLSSQGLGLAIVLMLVIYFINIGGVKIFRRVNNIAVTFKLIIPAATFFILIFHYFHLQNFHAQGGFMSMGVKGILTALPVAGVIYSFIGFNPAIQLAAEIKNPEKNIGFAIIGSILVCMVLYVALQIAFIGSLSPADFAQGWSQLSFVGDTGPFAGLMITLGIAWFVKLLYIDAIVSPVGTAVVQAAATGRLTYGMAQNYYLPQFLRRLNSHQSPALALGFNIIIGFFFFLPFPSWQKMVGFLVSCLVIGYVVGPISLLTLQEVIPERIKYSSKVNITALSLFAFYVINLIIFWTGWDIISKVMISFSLGYIVLIGYRVFPSKQKNIDLDFKHGWWAIPYIIGLGLISYLGSYGGGINVIKFIWDFVVMAVFTTIIFFLAKYLSSRTEAIASTRKRVTAYLENQ